VNNQIQGRVQNFDRSNNTLTLSGSDKPLHVDSSTVILKDGGNASVGDIKEGDQIRASFANQAGETLQVQRLEVMTKPAAGAATGTTGSSDLGGGSTGSATQPSGTVSGSSSSAGTGSSIGTSGSMTGNAGSSSDTGMTSPSSSGSDKSTDKSTSKKKSHKSTGSTDSSSTSDSNSKTY